MIRLSTENSADILVVRVKKVSRENRVIVYEPAAAIKGRMPQEEIKHDLRRAANQRAAQALLDWAEPGKIAVCFTTAAVPVSYTGEAWYECAPAADGWWTLIRERTELALACVGPVGKLRTQLEAVVAGTHEALPAAGLAGEGLRVGGPSRRRQGQQQQDRQSAHVRLPLG